MTCFETPRGAVEIRELCTMDEMVTAETIQTRVWGPITPHPKEILIPIQHEGGLLAGAFASSGEMVGLIFSFPTRDPAVMHSQMLATLEGWRGMGIGARMKWYQRDWCLERGIQLLRWTVDPLRAANAELNIRRLGATSSTYYTDYYGVMQGIDAGAPTDRLLVEWPLLSERVIARSTGVPEDCGFPQAQPANMVIDGKPIHPRQNLTELQILIHLPGDFVRISQSEPDLALLWRTQTRGLFQHYFTHGYAISGFTRSGGPAYLLEKRQK